ncbi:hypothetical protein LCGC14_1951400 [marine sediment metagenome]|uniref:Uncharacterized protein n=1 Tax=marine sediment metagenome TaxID=412755 RepID=A0A0F9IEF9_9ZZZZ
MGRFTGIVERYGLKILFLFFILELQITSFIWIVGKITFELGFGNFLLFNIYISIPYILNFTIKRRDDKKGKYNEIIDFYSSIFFLLISLAMDLWEFNLFLYHFLLGLLGLLIFIIYIVLNLRYNRDSLISRIRFYLSFLFLLISILIIISALPITQVSLQLLPTKTYWFLSVLYVFFSIGLIISRFRPKIKRRR